MNASDIASCHCWWSNWTFLIIVSHNSFSRFCCHMKRCLSTRTLQINYILNVFVPFSYKSQQIKKPQQSYFFEISFFSSFISLSNRIGWPLDLCLTSCWLNRTFWHFTFLENTNRRLCTGVSISCLPISQYLHLRKQNKFLCIGERCRLGFLNNKNLYFICEALKMAGYDAHDDGPGFVGIRFCQEW